MARNQTPPPLRLPISDHVPDTAARTSSAMVPCSSVSIDSARKRLPTPASGNSSATCSGVSMLS
jgi:hypothetical protein